MSKDIDKHYVGIAHEKGRSVALGYFDGVHRGHEELAHTVVQRAVELDLQACMFSFDRYPKPVPENTILNAVVPGQESPTTYVLESPLPPVNRRFKGLIQTDRQRDRHFARLGIELLILQEFNKQFASMEPEDFLNIIIKDRLNTKVLVVGEGYRFSRNQRGDVALLEQWCLENEIELHVIPPVLAGNEVVSSTRIRNAIEAGDMEEVQRLLGDPFAMPGTVIRGNAIGRTIGMPTANFRVPSGMVVPKYGVYVSRTRVGETFFDSITNIGLRPTVNHTDPQALVETWILDRTIDLYDEYIEIEFLHFMRPEIQFPSFIAMSNEIQKDLVAAKEWHNNSSITYLYASKNDIPLYMSRCGRYNTSYFAIEFYQALDKIKSSEYALLAHVMTATSRELPTRPELHSYLDHHYGSKITVDLAAVNNMQKLTLMFDAVHTGLDGSKPFEEAHHMLLDMVMNPNRDESGMFPTHIIETERQNLLMLLRAQEDNKHEMVLHKAKGFLLEEGKVHVNPLGDYEVVKNISADDLANAWRRLVSESQIRIFLGGKLEDTKLADDIMRQVAILPRMRNTLELIPGRFPRIMRFGPSKKIVERDTVDNPHIVIVLSGLPAYTSMKCASARVLNLILDGANGYLARGLQDDLGLSYILRSDYSSFQQTITISLEVSLVDIQDVIENILLQIERIQAGELDDALFNSAKLSNHNQILQTADDRERSLQTNSYELLSGRKFIGDNADYFAASVSKEDVLNLAKNLVLQLEYVVLPEDTAKQVWEK